MFISVIYSDAQASNIKYLQNLQVAEKNLFSCERHLSNTGEHPGRYQFYGERKRPALQKWICEFENYESLDKKDMRRNVPQQL